MSTRPQHAGDEVPIERVRLRDWVRTYEDGRGEWGTVRYRAELTHTASQRKAIELRGALLSGDPFRIRGWVNETRIEAATAAQARRCDWYPQEVPA